MPVVLSRLPSSPGTPGDGPASDGPDVVAVEVDDRGDVLPGRGDDRRTVRAADLPAVVVDRERGAAGTGPRWVWDDTTRWYPGLLRAGVRVERCHDLRLSRAILRRSALAQGSDVARAPLDALDAAQPEPGEATRRSLAVAAGVAPSAVRQTTLFDAPAPADPHPGVDAVAEHRAQATAVAGAGPDAGRLRLLLAAESAGALVAAEMHHAGLPWRADVHDAILTEALGPRPRAGARPARMEALAVRVRAALDAPPTLNPDSHPDLLKAMQYAGVGVRSLQKWELQRVEHPVVAPLLEYKALSRLHTANGWGWLDAWVQGGRFRTEYVVGGVVTGRWASSGGGALQLPRAVRRAVVADPGWVLVVADAAQLEPRVLAGLARDERMAAAGRGVDLYAGIVASGAVETREHAKVGMLGAMYGGTTGDSALVLPRLAAAFPDALGLVERAARAGERGEVVTTRLGRSSPQPGAEEAAVQAGAFAEDAGSDAQARARARTRAWGRFTRNFVVQGTAAEWALCWMAGLRRRLAELPAGDVPGLAPAPFADRAHLAFFLHDEVVVHAPAALADDVAAAVRESAAEAGRLLFAGFDVDFPVTVAVVEDYASAK